MLECVQEMREAELRGVFFFFSFATLHIKPIMLSRSGCGYMDRESVIGLNAGGGVGGVTLF